MQEIYLVIKMTTHCLPVHWMSMNCGLDWKQKLICCREKASCL